jgi:hypothetical protein
MRAAASAGPQIYRDHCFEHELLRQTRALRSNRQPRNRARDRRADEYDRAVAFIVSTRIVSMLSKRTLGVLAGRQKTCGTPSRVDLPIKRQQSMRQTRRTLRLSVARQGAKVFMPAKKRPARGRPFRCRYSFPIIPPAAAPTARLREPPARSPPASRVRRE